MHRLARFSPVQLGKIQTCLSVKCSHQQTCRRVLLQLWMTRAHHMYLVWPGPGPRCLEMRQWSTLFWCQSTVTTRVRHCELLHSALFSSFSPAVSSSAVKLRQVQAAPAATDMARGVDQVQSYSQLCSQMHTLLPLLCYKHSKATDVAPACRQSTARRPATSNMHPHVLVHQTTLQVHVLLPNNG